LIPQLTKERFLPFNESALGAGSTPHLFSRQGDLLGDRHLMWPNLASSDINLLQKIRN
jgi:hypothetical protein